MAMSAYQTAYQSVRSGPIKQVLIRTLTTLSAAAKRIRILADTEAVIELPRSAQWSTLACLEALGVVF
jgi:hypothetical protein